MKKHIMEKIMGLIILLIFIVMWLTGCLTPVSLDAYGYVISIGVDRGMKKKYYITLSLQRELSEQGAESDGGAAILAAEADSLDEALNEIEGNVPYSLSFSRTNYFLFSREVAESGDIEDFLSLSFDSLKIRTSAAMIITEGSVFEFVGGLSANNDANIKKLQEAVMLDMEKNGMIAMMSISRLFEANKDESFDYCAALGKFDDSIITDMEEKKTESEGKNPLGNVKLGDRVGGLKSFMAGAAVFSGYRMMETLTRDETMYLNMACGDYKNGTVSIPFSQNGEELGMVTLILSKQHIGRRVIINEDGSIRAEVDIRLAAGTHAKPDEANQTEMEHWINETAVNCIRQKLNDVFIKCRDAGSDAMRFGTEAIKLFRSDAEWKEFDWKSRYGSVEAVFNVELINTDKGTSGDMQ
ncbi:MAG: hypothetical protein IKX58_01550 [Clostridia bacterium]|nr:hypothetical protein [Clostridia bacterium]